MASTISAINDINTSPDVYFLLLQVPYLFNNGEPPATPHYDLFLPPGNNTKCATYVRKNLNLSPRITKHSKSVILAIVVNIQNTEIELLNVYTLMGKEATNFLRSHIPHRNTIMSGDFNSYHTMWYGARSPKYAHSIHNSKTHTTAVVNWTTQHAMTLLNLPRTFTHFPYSNNRPSIVDLTFASRYAATVADNWQSDQGSGGTADHPLTTTILNVGVIQYITRRVHQKTNWAAFGKHIKSLRLSDETWETRESTLQVAIDLGRKLQEAIDIAVPLSKPFTDSKRWWAPELIILKQKLGSLKHSIRTKTTPPEAKMELKNLKQAWTRKIQMTQ